MGRAVRAMEGEGWVWLERVHRPGGGRRRVDLVLVGPGGIVVVDFRRWVGRIEVARGVLRQNGLWREAEVAEVAGIAGSLAALLRPEHRTAVHAVICVAQHDLAAHLIAPGVHVVGVTALARTLRELPRRLRPAEIQQVQRWLRRTLGGDTSPEELTTAALGLPVPVPVVGPAPVVLPVAGRTGSGTSGRRGGGPRRCRRVDGRVLAVRLLLATLLSAVAVVLGPVLASGPG